MKTVQMSLVDQGETVKGRAVGVTPAGLCNGLQ